MVRASSGRSSIEPPWCRVTPISGTAMRLIAVIFPVWTGSASNSCPRAWRLQASAVSDSRLPWNPSDHHSAIVSRGLRGALNWFSIMPRDASLPVSGCKFCQSMVDPPPLPPCGPWPEYTHRFPACRVKRQKGCPEGSVSTAWDYGGLLCNLYRDAGPKLL